MKHITTRAMYPMTLCNYDLSLLLSSSPCWLNVIYNGTSTWSTQTKRKQCPECKELLPLALLNYSNL